MSGGLAVIPSLLSGQALSAAKDQRSEASLRPSSQTLRGVYPERSEWAQGDSERVGHVILSAAKDLSLGRAQILRCAQDDSSAEVNAYGVVTTPLKSSVSVH